MRPRIRFFVPIFTPYRAQETICGARYQIQVTCILSHVLFSRLLPAELSPIFSDTQKSLKYLRNNYLAVHYSKLHIATCRWLIIIIFLTIVYNTQRFDDALSLLHVPDSRVTPRPLSEDPMCSGKMCHLIENLDPSGFKACFAAL